MVQSYNVRMQLATLAPVGLDDGVFLVHGKADRHIALDLHPQRCCPDIDAKRLALPMCS
jgi:hypothetical protein